MRIKLPVLLLVGVILIQAGYLYHLEGIVVETPERPTSMRVQLTLEHIRAGNVIDKRMKEGDLILENFGALLFNAFCGWEGAEVRAYKNVGGTARVGYILPKMQDDGGYMYIGTGTTAPTLDDYCIETAYGSARSINDDGCLIYETSGNDINITVVGYFSCTSTADITEVAFHSRWYYGSTNSDNFLITRDTFSPVSVVSGDALAVYIKIIIDQ